MTTPAPPVKYVVSWKPYTWKKTTSIRAKQTRATFEQICNGVKIRAVSPVTMNLTCPMKYGRSGSYFSRTSTNFPKSNLKVSRQLLSLANTRAHTYVWHYFVTHTKIDRSVVVRPEKPLLLRVSVDMGGFRIALQSLRRFREFVEWCTYLVRSSTCRNCSTDSSIACVYGV